MTDTDIVVADAPKIEVYVGEADVKRSLEELKWLRTYIENEFKEGLDYGVIPGTTKNTLLQPGAQKVIMLFNCYSKPEDERLELPEGHVEHTVTSHIIARSTGQEVSTGVGSCSSMESNYRFRKADRTCPKCGQTAITKGKEEYGGGWLCWKKNGGCGAKFGERDPQIINQPVGQVENPNIWDIRNTVLKMAKKRAEINAAMALGCLSDFFTQDMDDVYPLGAVIDAEPEHRVNPETGQIGADVPVVKPAPKGNGELAQLIETLASAEGESTELTMASLRGHLPAIQGKRLNQLSEDTQQELRALIVGRLNELTTEHRDFLETRGAKQQVPEEPGTLPF